MLSPSDFFDLTEYEHRAVFEGCAHVWQALIALDDYLERILPSAANERQIEGEVSPDAVLQGGRIHIGAGSSVEAGAFIAGPCWIGEGSEVRHGAYIRGQLLAGDRCIVGHATEIKHSILLDGAKAPHFAYVGDSILGRDVNLGAGTKLSNLAIVSEKDRESGRRPSLRIPTADEAIDTGLTKLGAILGDGVQTGCNSVTNPGCLIGPRSLVYPNASIAKGVHPADSVLKLRQSLARIPRR